MGKDAWKSRKVRQACQDGSREFITCNAYVFAVSIRVLATLLYKGENYDLRHTWVEDLQDDNDFFFNALSNKWSNDKYSF